MSGGAPLRGRDLALVLVIVATWALNFLTSARALQDSELGRALGRLPDKMRLIVHLHYYEGFSTEEIARLVHCAPATVRSRLSRARTQLGKMLGKGGIL